MTTYIISMLQFVAFSTEKFEVTIPNLNKHSLELNANLCLVQCRIVFKSQNCIFFSYIISTLLFLFVYSFILLLLFSRYFHPWQFPPWTWNVLNVWNGSLLCCGRKSSRGTRSRKSVMGTFWVSTARWGSTYTLRPTGRAWDCGCPPCWSRGWASCVESWSRRTHTGCRWEEKLCSTWNIWVKRGNTCLKIYMHFTFCSSLSPFHAEWRAAETTTRESGSAAGWFRTAAQSSGCTDWGINSRFSPFFAK